MFRTARSFTLFAFCLPLLATAQTGTDYQGSDADRSRERFERRVALRWAARDSMHVYSYVDTFPTPPAGDKWKTQCEVALRDTACTPPIAVEMSFIVERDGRISTARLLRGMCKNYNEAAKCTLMRMPPWGPAWLNGRKVRAVMDTTIVFGPR